MKYKNYIELSANYESVVDLDAEERNPNLWQEYIVHDDMKRAIDAVCQTMNWEDNDKRRSFWIHGAYGTGKSYAAIVLKHLFEDEVTNIEKFMSKPSLAAYKKRFLKLRQKGEYLVAWKSGATDIKSGTHLMMEMEAKIKEKLAEKYGEKAYYGRNSLINAAKEAVSNKIINWDFVFDNPIYGLSDEYADLAAFRKAVLDEDYSAINKVKRICDDQHLSMFANTVDKFEEWLKDIIAGNNLRDTGIVFIWDEFTGFLRDCGDDNVLQRLSEFCKQPNSPFFMCLIVHRDPTWVDQLGGETYERILHRYHELEFHITESAAYDLIGDSIIPRPGMESQWEEIKKGLLKSIDKYKSEFDNLDQSININERMSKLCPLHPMTLSLLATVAQNFGASQRTLFRFMKDRAESSQGVGFINYIENNDPDEWGWLTADYLWDYFFTRGSDVRNFNAEARKVIQHFNNKQESISDEYAMHVFKAALLLIAVMSSSSVSNLYSRQNNAGTRIGATKNTLYKCFRGQLAQSTIDTYLQSFEEIGLLRLDKLANGDARLELPYVGGGDPFDIRFETTKKKHTRYTLFSKGGVFSKALEGSLWDSTKATFGRMFIAVCSSETNSFTVRLGEIKAELSKSPWKIGLLVVIASEASDYIMFQTKIKQIAAEDDTSRLVVALMKEPCTNDLLDQWYTAITHKELSAEEGKPGSASKYEAQAAAYVAQWAAVTSSEQIFACYGDIQFSSLYGQSDLIRRIENDVLFRVFPAAPEKIVISNTAYKKCNDKAVLAGIKKEEVGNSQIKNISNALKEIDAWEIGDLDTLSNLPNPKALPVTELAKFIQQELTDGAKISLDTLWASLQKAPFGYYNSLVAGCFIGLTLRSFVNASFNWIDSNNNTHLPTAENLASMVNKMLDGKTLNNFLSSGSAIWQKFKPYAKAVFGLSDRDSVSEAETRNHIRAKIQGIGVPFWAMKYLPDEKFGGVDAKNAAVKLTDHLCDFIYETSSNQDNVMAEVITLFNGRGGLRKTMADILSDKPVMYDAFRRFINTKAPEVQLLCEQLSYTDKDLFDALRGYMQDAISTWREEQVSSELVALAEELSLIVTLNQALGVNKKTYASLQKELNNVFDHMKIPGTMVETLTFSWVPTLKIMRSISKNSWTEITEKISVRENLRVSAKTVWEYLSQPKLILEAVLQARNIYYSDSELNEIYKSLKPLLYETAVTVFNSSVERSLENISYNRNAALLKQLWSEKSGATSVVEWCNSANVPIAWVVDSSALTAIETVKAIQDGRRVNNDDLTSTVSVLRNINFAVLKDKKHISDRFLACIGENYRDAFNTDRAVLLDRIKTNARISHDVYSWANKIPEIRAILDTYLQKTYQEQAIARVKSMPDSELREAVIHLLNSSPELYSNFLK
jgi:hypothetical protein